MSYLVLARKYRSQTLDDLIGQETIVKTLKNSLSSGKIVHAYLFSGPRGVGKTSTARVLAKALNCTERVNAEPCGRCRNCSAITGGSSIDVLEIDGASNTSVDNVRELRETVKYAPSSGKYKVYIIDEVHMLSTPAFNALLKTLEEPPSHVIFVFATTEPKKVPVTILSRCQHHAFRKIPKALIKERISKIAAAENIAIQDTAVEMIARAADGSMRDALTVLDQASSFSEEISERDLQTLLGLPEADIITGFSDSILTGDISSTLSTIKELTERGYDFRPLMKELLDHFRNIAVIKVTEHPEEFLEFTGEEIKNLQQQASKTSIEELTLLLTELLKLEAEVRNAANPRYTLELGLLRTSFIKGMASIDGLLKQLEGEEDHTLPHPTETIPRSHFEGEAGEGSGKTRTPQTKNTLWPDIMKRIKEKDNLLAYKLAEAKIVSVTDSAFTIGLNGGMSVLSGSIKKNAPLIEEAIQDITGGNLKLKIVSLPEKKTARNEIKKDVLSNPVIKNAMDIFNGRIRGIKSLQDTEQ
jgi:DNA polymerase-3 subunit gamma/tau